MSTADAIAASARAARARTTQRLEDACYLLDSGEHPARVVTRLGMPSIYALEAMLRHHGRRYPQVVAERTYQRYQTTKTKEERHD